MYIQAYVTINMIAKTKYIECTSIIKLFVKTVFIIISGIPAPSNSQNIGQIYGFSGEKYREAKKKYRKIHV